MQNIKYEYFYKYYIITWNYIIFIKILIIYFNEVGILLWIIYKYDNLLNIYYKYYKLIITQFHVKYL